MSKENNTTGTLLSKLFKTSNVGRFIKNHDKDMQDYLSFDKYLKQLCTEKNLKPGWVIKKSNLERTYGHQIFNGTRNPSRDKVIQLAFGFGLDYDETQELIKEARKNPLYAKIKRDAVIIYALKNEHSITALDNTLYELSLPLLGKEE